MFQTVAFLSAVCDGIVDGSKVLILCQNKNKLLHWKYHCSVLLPNLKTLIADDQQLNADAESCIILSSIDNALAHLNELKAIKYRFVTLHDEHLEVNFDALAKIRSIIGNDSRKLIVSSADILVSIKSSAT